VEGVPGRDRGPGRGAGVRSVFERRGNNLKSFKACCLKVKAIIWPGLAYMCHIRSAGNIICIIESGRGTGSGSGSGRRGGCPTSRNTLLYRCRASAAHIRQSKPDSGVGFQVKALKNILSSSGKVVPSSLGNGRGTGSGSGSGRRGGCPISRNTSFGACLRVSGIWHLIPDQIPYHQPWVDGKGAGYRWGSTSRV